MHGFNALFSENHNQEANIANHPNYSPDQHVLSSCPFNEIYIQEDCEDDWGKTVQDGADDVYCNKYDSCNDSLPRLWNWLLSSETGNFRWIHKIS